MRPLLVSSGEPAGVGPDLCLDLAHYALPVVVLADKTVLHDRAKILGKTLNLIDYQPDLSPVFAPNTLVVQHIPCAVKPHAGKLDPQNSPYVITMLEWAIDQCLQGKAAGLVTAPVHKAVINQANIVFNGHTEFLANRCGVDTVVMMLACKTMKVALLTTHLPLKDVPAAITRTKLLQVVGIIHQALQQEFGLAQPRIFIAGLNPHAGESGYLGREEIDVIAPAIQALQLQGIDATGPYPADTLFTRQHLQHCDVILAMYHDQGLPVIKYADFHHTVNITLGLPIIRTSVDHGTALDLAGTGHADSRSLLTAVEMAQAMSNKKG